VLHRQAERAGCRDVALVDPAQLRAPDRVGDEGRDLDVLGEWDIRLEHDPRLDSAVCEEQRTFPDNRLETDHAPSLQFGGSARDNLATGG